MFGKKSEDETEEERTKRWSTFNDTLRKMVLGTYIGAKLPSYFRLEFDLIESPQWKSFFIQRVLVFHYHLKSKEKRKLDLLLWNLRPYSQS